MSSAEHALTIDAEPAAVWRVLTDPLRFPDWVYGVRRIDFVTDERRGVGAQWRQVNAYGPMVVTVLNEVTEEDEPRVFTVETASKPHAEVRHELTELEDGRTEVRLHMEYEFPAGAVGRAAEPLLGDSVGNALVRRTLENLKRVVEQEERRARERAEEREADTSGGADQPPVRP